MMVTQTPCLRRQIALIIKFKHVTEGYVRWSVARTRGKGGDSVVLLRERAHDQNDHEAQHELLLGG